MAGSYAKKGFVPAIVSDLGMDSESFNSWVYFSSIRLSHGPRVEWFWREGKGIPGGTISWHGPWKMKRKETTGHNNEKFKTRRFSRHSTIIFSLLAAELVLDQVLTVSTQREQEHDTVKKEKRAGCGKERKHNASQLTIKTWSTINLTQVLAHCPVMRLMVYERKRKG